ncbi:Toll-like receptor 7 Precursor [Larimichthys crocea]|uniref:Toll-like receptor 7 n=1 Tax=Larimichthys crocea TaxID=215358 RepID=A0A6G0J6N0_LARCR|nr:Toll-like receptor 7 Precursor [Larimichthys crocea]
MPWATSVTASCGERQPLTVTIKTDRCPTHALFSVSSVPFSRDKNTVSKADREADQSNTALALEDMSLKARLARVNSMKGKTYSLCTGFALARKDALDMVSVLRSSVGIAGGRQEVSGDDMDSFSQLLFMQAKVLRSDCSQMAAEYSSPEELLLTLTHSFHTLCCLTQACMSLVEGLSAEGERREVVAKVDEVVMNYVCLLKAAESASGGSPSDQSMCVPLLGLWCFLSISTSSISYPKTLPCDVSEESNGTELKVNCTERNLKDVPNGIPRDTTNLTLTINHIPQLNSTSFRDLVNLTEIDMRCNCVPVKIGPKDRICSKSVTIEEHAFAGLKNLRALYLDGNQLDSIPKGLPSNLILLSLESNNLSYIPHQLPTSLKELYLYNNNIEEVTDEDFKNLTNLEILDISGNCPRCYNAPYPCNPCPNNSPLKISKTAFKMLTKLKTLRMHSNSLISVPSDWFANMQELRVLDLSSNFLAREMGVTAFPRFLGKLEELDLSFNYELQNTTVPIPRLATDVTCASPGAQRGKAVVLVDLQACQHSYLSIILYTLMTSLILSFLALSISSHLFLWDVWYIYHFCRAKLKGYGRLYSQSSVYDAFVMYDKEDPAVTEWVMKEMCFHLEERWRPSSDAVSGGTRLDPWMSSNRQPLPEHPQEQEDHVHSHQQIYSKWQLQDSFLHGSPEADG